MFPKQVCNPQLIKTERLNLMKGYPKVWQEFY